MKKSELKLRASKIIVDGKRVTVIDPEMLNDNDLDIAMKKKFGKKYNGIAEDKND